MAPLISGAIRFILEVVQDIILEYQLHAIILQVKSPN